MFTRVSIPRDAEPVGLGRSQAHLSRLAVASMRLGFRTAGLLGPYELSFYLLRLLSNSPQILQVGVHRIAWHIAPRRLISICLWLC